MEPLDCICRFLDEDYDGLDEDEDQLFSLRPIRDEWRQLFDKYDPEGFGEIPLDDFEVALETRDFLEAISPGKLIILQVNLMITYFYKEVRKQKVHLLFFLQFSNRWWMPNSIFATPKIDQNLSFLAVFFLYIVLEVLREVLLLGAVWIVLLSPFSYMGKTFDDMYHLFSIFVSITG